MSRKTLLLIIIFLALAIVGFVIYIFVKEEVNISSIPAVSRFFPEAEPEQPKDESGINGENSSNTASTIIGIAENGEKNQKPALIQLTNKVIGGAAFIKENETVRFIEKSTGHLYEISPQGDNLIRLSNTTIPNVFEVFWSTDGKNAVLRYSKDNKINNFLANFTGSTTDGMFLPENIISVLLPENNEKIYYAQKNNSTGSVVESDFKLKNKRQILSSSFTDFILIPEGKSYIGLLTKPSFFSNGYLYSLNTATKNYTKALENIPGLNALWSKDGEKIFYSESSSENIIQNKILDTTNKKELNLGVKTFPEKCVWSNLDKNTLYCSFPTNLTRGEYPDDWYKGLIQFNDELWKINYKTGETSVLSGPEQIRQKNLDIINLFLSEKEEFLFFTNKKDGSLWSLKLGF